MAITQANIVLMFLINAGILSTCCYILVKLYHVIMKRNRNYLELFCITGAILCGYVSMYIGIVLTSSVRIDLRFIPVLLAPLFLRNPISIFLVSLGIAILRLTFGISKGAYVGATDILTIGLVVSILHFFWQHKMNFIRLGYYILIGNILNVGVIALFNVIDFNEFIVHIVPYTFISGVAFSIFIALMLRDMNSEIERRTRYERDIYIDSLTGIFNHRYIEQYMRQLQDKQDIEKFTVLFIDLDYFKKINDKYGHMIGDYALRKVSFELEAAFSKTGTVARYGGEEFVVILPDTSAKEGLKLIEKVRIKMAQHKLRHHSGIEFSLTFSCGIASYPEISKKEIIDKADKGLYEAKSKGRNRSVVYHDEKLKITGGINREN